jgi:hypothetical protein
MKRKLRAPGLVLSAVVAMSALTASAAQAGEFTAEEFPVTFTGTQLGKHQFKFESGTVSCAAVSFDGQLAAPANMLTLTPSYKECTTPGGAEIVIRMTTCDFRLHANQTLENDRVAGSLDVQCAQAGDTIDIEEPETGCIVKIPAQNGLGSLVYTDHTMAKDFDIDFEVMNMEYGQNANCPGGAEVFNTGQYGGQSTITGDHEGAGTGVFVK